MGFSSQRAGCCLSNQFQYCLLIMCIKIVAFKHQQFKDSEKDVIKPKASKPPRIDTHDNEER